MEEKSRKEMRMGTMTVEDVHYIFSQRKSKLILGGRSQVNNKTKNPFKMVS